MLSMMWHDDDMPVGGKVLAFIVALMACISVLVFAMTLCAIATSGTAIAVTAAVIAVPSLLIALALKSAPKPPSLSSAAEDPQNSLKD